MRWLHFSDFHIGREQAPERAAISSLVDAIKAALALNPRPVDAVFLVGDLVYGGNHSEFERFEQEFYEPLMSLDGLENAQVIAVPGNHDVDCDVGYPLVWDKMKRLQGSFFGEDSIGVKTRLARSEAFQAYKEFTNKLGIISPDPSNEVSIVHNEPNWPFAVIATNTSFFSDKDEKSSDPITPCPLISLRGMVAKIPAGKPGILLGHHHEKGFLESQQDQFRNFLVEKKLLYLHGHEHRPRLDFNQNGSVRLIGFGASYAASLEADEGSLYRNSFALCDLDEKLSLRGYSWDPIIGRWVDTTASQFAVGFQGEVLQNEPLQLDLPGDHNQGASQKSQGGRSIKSIKDIPRKSPTPNSVIPLPGVSSKIWMRFIGIGRFISAVYDPVQTTVTTDVVPDGRVEMVLETDGQRDLLVCIPAGGHIMGEAEVQAFNTRLDTEDLTSVTVVSFGRLSSEGRVLYLRFSEKKALEILENSDLIDSSNDILTLEQTNSLERLEKSVSSIDIIIFEEDAFLLVRERRGEDRSFFLIDKNGEVVASNESCVIKLREVTPAISDLRYAGEALTDDEALECREFSENEYLETCFSQANRIRYSSLANIGLRPELYTLENIYVEANASEIEGQESSRHQDLIEDHLDAYPVSDSLKSRIKKNLLAGDPSDGRTESATAREFCQKHGAVLVTGDPGSGKTCFVNNEILEYCKRTQGPTESTSDEKGGSWYSEHLPIFVPLSQVVAEKNFSESGLLDALVGVLEKRGLDFTLPTMTNYLNVGKIAFFFDGLDEVVSIEKRAILVQAINDLVTTYAELGNRFVVTSRPAAIHVVNMLPAMKQLALQGLTESEISCLATRILGLRVGEGVEGVFVDEAKPKVEDSTVVAQLLADCREKKGVARLAQNPLLLTLLVTIYANAGAPAAKRHLIYDEAIKTLSSARQRQAGHLPVSVQDLRKRLGRVALSVYRKESGFLPTKDEVVSTIQSVMEDQRSEPVDISEAEEFIQKVAESTGLISIASGNDGDSGSGVVTFIHHSFLEYFAAWALCSEFESIDLHHLVREPRWHEVLTLVAGIVGESEDAAPVIKKILDTPSPADCVDARDLIFAMDCALESDVPSEGAVRVLSNAIRSCLTNGACRVDSKVRENVAERLGILWISSGGSTFETMLLELLDSTDNTVVAATITLIGHAFANGADSEVLIAKLDSKAKDATDVIARALCRSAGLEVKLRTEPIRACILKSLKGTSKVKAAAFEALVSMPGLAVECWPDILNGLEDDDQFVQRLAGVSAIQAGLNTDLIAGGETKRELVLRAFEAAEMTSDHGFEKYTKIGEESVNRLLASGIQKNRILGLRLLPFVDQSGASIRDNLIEALQDEKSDREELVAALNAFRWSSDARTLCKIKDLRIFISFLERGTGDVREAAMRLLGCFLAESSAVKAILDRRPGKMSRGEYFAWIGCLSHVRVHLDLASKTLDSELVHFLKSGKMQNPKVVGRFIGVLNALQELGEPLRQSTVEQLKPMVDDFRIDYKIRGAAALTFAACSQPSSNLMKTVGAWVLNTDPKFEDYAVELPKLVAINVRRDVKYVIACVAGLSHLNENAINLHQRFCKRATTTLLEENIGKLREGITEVDRIIIAFDEFLADEN
ncbi:MAG: metallophosphoesterase [Verrucomicrobiales bacterium]|nr:metallophosphoesterase [Verrucomicrobiales bacterium]